MMFYIDPGTGSMLFTILIGVIGAAIYALRNSWVKLKVLLSGGKKPKQGICPDPLCIFHRQQALLDHLQAPLRRDGKARGNRAVPHGFSG